jgi:hypothetical protein
MSVTAMAGLASDPPRREASNETPAEKNLRLIVTYIPSEAVALYLLFLGTLLAIITDPANQQAARWVSFAVGLLAGIALAYLGFKPGTNDTDTTTRNKRLGLVAFATVAFFAYSVATPGGPWQGSIIGAPLSIWGSLLAAVLAVFLPKLAERFNLRPPG